MMKGRASGLFRHFGVRDSLFDIRHSIRSIAAFQKARPDVTVVR